MDDLQALHELERYLGYDLNRKDGDDVLDYLNDEPMDTSPQYLTELFGFKPWLEEWLESELKQLYEDQ